MIGVNIDIVNTEEQMHNSCDIQINLEMSL